MVRPPVRSRLRPGSLLGPGLALVAAALAAPPPAISWRADRRAAAVEVEGVAPAALEALRDRPAADESWRDTLAVFAEPPGAAAGRGGTALPPMAGSWCVSGDRLRFEPRFPFDRGLRYRAEFRSATGPVLVSYFELPPDTTPPTTTVAAVYPSGDELPENQLKFYVQFSAPMSRGDIYEHIRLRDDADRPIDLAFLELGEELWDPGMTRLTLLIDPGRIKRGVRPLEEAGPVLEAGRTYALTVSADCRDAEGRRLRLPFEKRFRAGPADRTPPDPARWRVAVPAAGTREPLVVAFDEPMDHALAGRLLHVEGVAGETALDQHERRWTFVPAAPWRSGPHRILVATTIEDLAGNNIGKPFDVDVFAGVQRRLATDTVALAFAVP